jgi:hypothetical protein
MLLHAGKETFWLAHNEVKLIFQCMEGAISGSQCAWNTGFVPVIDDSPILNDDEMRNWAALRVAPPAAPRAA